MLCQIVQKCGRVQLSIIYLFTYIFIFVIYLFIIDRHNSVGIVTCYGLDDPGIESR